MISTAMPIVDGVTALAKNLLWGQNVSVKTVDVEKIKKSFGDSKKFVAELKSSYPENYKNIAKLRQDLKVYQFDLVNIVNDLELMAQSTKNDVKKVRRNLGLRSKRLQEGRDKKRAFTASFDEKLWKRTIKYSSNNLGASIEKCDKIIEALKKL